MNRITIKTSLIVLSLLPVVIAGAGCQRSTEGSGSPPLSVEEQIKKIENDPNIPPQAKPNIINNIRQSAARGQAQEAAMKQSGSGTQQAAPPGPAAK